MFTYFEVMTEARNMLRDENGTFNWSDPVILIIANDGAELLHKMLSATCRDMFIVASSLALSKVAGYGPYDLPADFNYVDCVLDSRQRLLGLTSKEESLEQAAALSGEPEKYWIQGWNPARMYFERTPDTSYSFTLNYLPVFTRAVSSSAVVPLPDGCRSAMRAWIEKMAGIVDEYNTMDEQQKLEILTPLINRETLKRCNKISFFVSGVGF